MWFKNPQNGYTEGIANAWVWALLFGCLYFAIKGVWTHAIVGLILAIMTMGLSWLIYPFFTDSIMRKHYLRSGWVELKPAPAFSISDH